MHMTDKQKALRWLSQAMTDFINTLPLSAREPMAAVADQALGLVASDSPPEVSPSTEVSRPPEA